MDEQGFVSDRHVLYVGWVIGIARRYDVPLHPVVDGVGNYTSRLTLDLTPDVSITFVVPPPSDDWELTGTMHVEPR
jgi:hypothetical protein